MAASVVLLASLLCMAMAAGLGSRARRSRLLALMSGLFLILAGIRVLAILGMFEAPLSAMVSTLIASTFALLGLLQCLYAYTFYRHQNNKGTNSGEAWHR